MSAITANLPNFHPHLLDALHDAQRHIKVACDVITALAEGEGLVDDSLLEILRVVVLDWDGGLYTRHWHERGGQRAVTFVMTREL